MIDYENGNGLCSCCQQPEPRDQIVHFIEKLSPEERSRIVSVYSDYSCAVTAVLSELDEQGLNDDPVSIFEAVGIKWPGFSPMLCESSSWLR